MNVLIVEDNLFTRRLLEESLDPSYSITSVSLGENALFELTKKEFHFVLLDINLPKISGLEVLKKIKTNPRYKDPYTLIITNNTNDEQVIEAFKIGADDYIKKPFNPIEINLRINSGAKNKFSLKREFINYYNLQLSCNDMIVNYQNKNMKISTKEFEVLKYLILNQSILVNKQKIFHEVWGQTYFPDNRTLDVILGRIKTKFPIIKENLKTIYGKGVVLNSCLD